MNSVFVYCELEGTQIEEVSFELLTKGRKLASELGVKLEAIVAGHDVKGKVESQILPYGVDVLHVFDAPGLSPYTTRPHTAVLVHLFEREQPQICLMGATSIGRDLGPRVSSTLTSGLTADCTALEIGDYEDKKNKKNYENLLYQIRPAFGGNLMATIVSPTSRPQMSTVRPGVMSKLERKPGATGEIIKCNVELDASDIRTKIVDIVKSAKEMVSLTDADIICSGGRGLGDAKGFELIQKLADKVGGVVGSSRAAVDSGWIDHSHQVGQTGTTVKPQIYFACGISGAIQHLAGMQDSDIIIAINKDADAPIFEVADYGIVGDLYQVIPQIIEEWDNAEALADAVAE